MRVLRRVLMSVVLAALAGGLGLVGCAAKQAEVAEPFVPSADLASLGLKQVWQRPLMLEAGEHVANAWRVEDSVYVTTTRGTIMRLDAATGQEVWDNTLPEKHDVIYRPAETSDKKAVVVVDQGYAYCYSKWSGALLLSKPLPITVLTDPYISGNMLCLGSVNYFYGFYVDQLGGQKWVTSAPGDIFVTPPVPVADKMILTSREGHLWRISPQTGEWDWKDRKANGLVLGTPAAGEKGIFVPALDKRVYAFDLKSGGQLWDTRVEGTLDQPIAATRTKVLVPTSDNGFYALSQDKGDIVWHVDGVMHIGTITAGKVWVMDGGGNVKCLNLETGELIGSAPVADAFGIMRNTTDQMIMTVNRAGVVAAYEQK